MTRLEVVGGGLGGLVTAIAAREAGLEVDLFEAKAQLGGRARVDHGPARGQLGTPRPLLRRVPLDVAAGPGAAPAGGQAPAAPAAADAPARRAASGPATRSSPARARPHPRPDSTGGPDLRRVGRGAGRRRRRRSALERRRRVQLRPRSRSPLRCVRTRTGPARLPGRVAGALRGRRLELPRRRSRGAGPRAGSRDRDRYTRRHAPRAAGRRRPLTGRGGAAPRRPDADRAGHPHRAPRPRGFRPPRRPVRRPGPGRVGLDRDLHVRRSVPRARG